MKLNKRIALVLIVSFLLTIVAGCGASKPAEPVKPKEILIGANFELTGNVATFGVSTTNGIEMAIAEINATGGVLGLPIKLIKADNKSDAAEATNIATKLVNQDKVIALLGPVTSTNVLASLPVAETAKIPQITSSGTNPKITFDNGKTREWAFRTCYIDPFQGLIGVNFAINNLKAKTAAILIEKNSDYAKGLAEVFETNFVAKGGQIVSKEAFVTEDKDFKAILTKIKATKPDVLYVPSYYEQDGLIAKQARELGYTNPIVGADGWDSDKLVEIAGAKALEKVYFTNHYSPEDKDPKIVKFVTGYKAKYNATPDALAALGYDSAYMLADAIKRAGAADSAKIKDALAATKGFVGVTGSVTIDEKHNPVKSMVILTFDKDGKQTMVEKINP